MNCTGCGGHPINWVCEYGCCPLCDTPILRNVKRDNGTGCIIALIGFLFSPFLIGIPVLIYGLARKGPIIQDQWYCRCGFSIAGRPGFEPRVSIGGGVSNSNLRGTLKVLGVVVIGVIAFFSLGAAILFPLMERTEQQARILSSAEAAAAKEDFEKAVRILEPHKDKEVFRPRYLEVKELLLLAELKNIPESDFQGNLQRYEWLMNNFPLNKRYREKYFYYREKVSR